MKKFALAASRLENKLLNFMLQTVPQVRAVRQMLPVYMLVYVSVKPL